MKAGILEPGETPVARQQTCEHFSESWEAEEHLLLEVVA